ncbi:phage/plasmid replication protein, II/X family [Aliivibrio fischeri]|uniref:phage/plasmid replication protein, II/X family n=2 Tax=Aliivibrio fischeri TaxID=668 RepID=UPI0007C56B24|nr:phage/plasmid replication protein, II/X family [Aliivibrio fischeri]MBP3140299.1 hypothetical protein [Aliivibrio fischeri]MBP3140308.1 hypothetical protein [Aliivibrio fischeri]MBP3154685.1 hypothetical protein [Aliivibrio fischeri]
MIDRLKLSIPFFDEFLIKTTALSSGSVEYVDIEECAKRGIRLEAKNVTFNTAEHINKYDINDLRHPYETLPTSYTGMAFKIFQGTPNRAPCVELKASPAKIIQGHNVYGSTSIHLGSSEMIAALYHVLPEFYEMLDVENTLLDLIDCTFSARLKNQNQVKQVIEQLKNISNKQMRTAVRNEHETTCYFSRNSRHVDRKAYGKGFEFQRQLADLRAKKEQGCNSYDHVIEVMSCPHLQNFAQNLLRLEAGAKRRYLDELSIPKKLVDAIKFQTEYEKNGNCLITDIWKRAFNPLLEALKGQKMNIFNDDEVHTQLKTAYFTITPKGNISYSKADRVFRFYRSLISDGYNAVKDSFSSRATFYRQLTLLLDVGFSKAQLQQLKGKGMDNVIPLLQVIEIDFSAQRPSNWVEPKTSPIVDFYLTGETNIVHLKRA